MYSPYVKGECYEKDGCNIVGINDYIHFVGSLCQGQPDAGNIIEIWLY